MHYIICHSGMAPLEVLAMCTRCKKALIVYHKSNGIMTMKKHVEYDHDVYVENPLRRCNFWGSKIPILL